jgi:proline iminopeptidase
MFAAFADADLFYRVQGSGPPMLVLHGGLGWDHSYLRSGLDQLGDQVTVVYYDHRGNGRSSEPEDWNAVTHQTWVDDVDALREHLGYDQIVLFGHSYGGALAQEYALRYPERLRGLILCDTAPAADGGPAAMANAHARATPEQFEVVLSGFTRPFTGDAAEFAERFGAILPLYFHGAVPDAAAAVFLEMRYRPSAFNRAIFGCYPQFRTLERLAEIPTPTLVLQGRHDWVTPPALGGDRLRAHLPDSDLVLFEQSGHFPFLEEPEAFRHAVSAFLTSLS